MKLNGVISSLIAVSILSGCIGRVPKVAPAVQPGDDNLSCTQILGSMVLNTQEVEKLVKEHNGNLDENTATNV
ncbi:MAG: hypothetical protein JXQ77_03920, partial [Campylobacterales bacterium]|nr:hypothetical protein [Campylobacterales bacterium]